MRLDPKLKFLAEIAARKQRRSLANFIEWSIEQSLQKVILREDQDVNGDNKFSVLDEANKLWDIEPSARFIKLAENYPDLLTFEEQIILKAIYEISTDEYYIDDDGETKIAIFDFVKGEGDNKKVDPYPVRICWTTLVAHAEGSASTEDVENALKKHLTAFKEG